MNLNEAKALKENNRLKYIGQGFDGYDKQKPFCKFISAKPSDEFTALVSYKGKGTYIPFLDLRLAKGRFNGIVGAIKDSGRLPLENPRPAMMRRMFYAEELMQVEKTVEELKKISSLVTEKDLKRASTEFIRDASLFIDSETMKKLARLAEKNNRTWYDQVLIFILNGLG